LHAQGPMTRCCQPSKSAAHSIVPQRAAPSPKTPRWPW
jgi:hypothetical protein